MASVQEYETLYNRCTLEAINLIQTQPKPALNA
jgi:hypothetical protein